MFFQNSLAFSMIKQMLAIWSLVPLPFLKRAWTSGSSQFTYCCILAWRILSIILLVCEMSALNAFKHSLALPFFGIGMKADFFQSCGHCWVFQICWHIECSPFTASSSRIEIAQLEFYHLHQLCSCPLTLYSRMSGSRWVITPSWLSELWRIFLYSSSVFATFS